MSSDSRPILTFYVVANKKLSHDGYSRILSLYIVIFNTYGNLRGIELVIPENLGRKAIGSLAVQTMHRGEMEEKENLKMVTLVQDILVTSDTEILKQELYLDSSIVKYNIGKERAIKYPKKCLL